MTKSRTREGLVPSEMLLLACSLFGTLTAYYLMKPVRDALLIHRAGVSALPYALVLQAGAALGTVFVLNLLSSRIRRRRFVLLTTFSFVIAVASFAALMGWTAPSAARIVAVAFYVWTTVYIVAALSTVWSLAADRYDEWIGRRSYLLIALASPCGAVAGAWLSESVVPLVGLAGSMLIAIAILTVVCAMATSLASGQGPPFDSSARVWIAGTQGLVNTLRHPLLARVSLLVVLGSCVWAILDRQVYFIVEKRGLVETATASFFGRAYSWINWATLAVQATLLVWMRRGLNPMYGIAVLPVLCIAGGTLGLVGIDSIAWIYVWGAFATLSYSLNNTSREMLYLRVSEDDKYRAKVVIDVFVLRASEALGGILLYAIYEVGNEWRIGLVIAGLGLFWLFTANGVRGVGSAPRLLS